MFILSLNSSIVLVLSHGFLKISPDQQHWGSEMVIAIFVGHILHTLCRHSHLARNHEHSLCHGFQSRLWLIDGSQVDISSINLFHECEAYSSCCSLDRTTWYPVGTSNFSIQNRTLNLPSSQPHLWSSLSQLMELLFTLSVQARHLGNMHVSSFLILL